MQQACSLISKKDEPIPEEKKFCKNIKQQQLGKKLALSEMDIFKRDMNKTPQVLL